MSFMIALSRGPYVRRQISASVTHLSSLIAAPVRRGGALLALLVLLACGSAQAASEPAGFIPFAPDSVWNLPLRDDAPISPNSAAYVDYLQQTVAANGAWVNSTSCGMPEYWANANTPTVSVTLNHSSYEDPALIQAWSAVPIPSNAEPANCGDKNFAVLQAQPDGSIKEWEFWEASQSSSGQWSAEWGGAINNVLTDRGEASPLEWMDPSATNSQERKSNDGWNVTASGVSMIAGVITNSDLASGSINHAVAMAVTAAASGKWMWPAQRTDGYSTNADAIPEGAHLRLSTSVNLNALNLTPLVKMIAEAAQKYGIVVRDQTASADVFYAEQPTAGEPSPLTPLLDGQSMSSALAAFPWSDLEVLDAPMCTSYSGCSATDQAVINVSPDPTVGQPVTLDTTNSVLNYPRSDVRWDMSGSGSYTVDAGTAVSETYLPSQAGSQTVSVQMTTADGAVTTGTTTFTVLPASTTTPSTPATASSATSPPSTTSADATQTPPSARASSSSISRRSTATMKAAASRAAEKALQRRSRATRAHKQTPKARREKSKRRSVVAKHLAGSRPAARVGTPRTRS